MVYCILFGILNYGCKKPPPPLKGLKKGEKLVVLKDLVLRGEEGGTLQLKEGTEVEFVEHGPTGPGDREMKVLVDGTRGLVSMKCFSNDF